MRLLLVITFLSCIVSSFPLIYQDWMVSLPSFINFDKKDRLIKLGPDSYKLISEDEKLTLRRKSIKFMDVTEQIPIEEAYEQGLISRPSAFSWLDSILLSGSKQVTHLAKQIPNYNYPKSTKFNKEVKELYRDIDLDLMFKKLSKFTSFYTRYYKSESGFDSSNWLYGEIEKIIEPVSDKVNITKIHHNGWDQFSIIVTIPGEVSDKVVIGAHQDSANLILPNIMRAPGADDDGSGTVTTLESLRLLIGLFSKNLFNIHNTLEFHWYSAEEGGLLGSVDVFSRYANAGEVVVGMLQQDMTGYTQGSIDAGVEPHFGLINDYTSVELNNFIKLIIKSYNSIPYHESQCGYACSDHASALENGYPSSFLIESEMKYTSKYIHSNLDTIDRLDWDHIKEHVKLTIAFAYELSFASNL